jgi:hypothetical protein
MQSSFGCFVADSSLARKAVLRVTVKVDLPVHLRESHFFSKCNHTFQWHHRVGITVQDEDLGHDSPRFHSHRRAQNAVQGDDTSQRSGGTRKLENAAASNTVSDGRDAIRIALRPLALAKTGVPATTAASLALSSGEKLSITSQLLWSAALYTYAITFKNEGEGPLHVTVAGVRYNNYAIDLHLEPGEDSSYEFQTVDGPEEREAIEADLKRINAELNTLGKRRSDMLSFLSSTDVFSKYKQISDEMVGLRADITSLERQRGFLTKLQEHRAEIRAITEERGRLQILIEADVERQNSDNNSLFSIIRLFFSEIVEDVIDRKALLSVSPNQEGHLEFKAEILDESGNTTSADLGHTYRKLLCIAFDMALLRAHLDHKFPRFVYHDGVFESLDPRKKQNLLAEIHKYTEMGIQSVITLIDSDSPEPSKDEDGAFTGEEIVLTLHDENMQGRLFRMKAW